MLLILYRATLRSWSIFSCTYACFWALLHKIGIVWCHFAFLQHAYRGNGVLVVTKIALLGVKDVTKPRAIMTVVLQGGMGTNVTNRVVTSAKHVHGQMDALNAMTDITDQHAPCHVVTAMVIVTKERETVYHVTMGSMVIGVSHLVGEDVKMDSAPKALGIVIASVGGQEVHVLTNVQATVLNVIPQDAQVVTLDIMGIPAGLDVLKTVMMAVQSQMENVTDVKTTSTVIDVILTVELTALHVIRILAALNVIMNPGVQHVISSVALVVNFGAVT